MDELLNIFIDPLKIAGKSIVLVVTYTILFLILEAFVPQFKKWGDTLFIIVLVLTLGQTVMESFGLIGEVVNVGLPNSFYRSHRFSCPLSLCSMQYFPS